MPENFVLGDIFISRLGAGFFFLRRKLFRINFYPTSYRFGLFYSVHGKDDRSTPKDCRSRTRPLPKEAGPSLDDGYRSDQWIKRNEEKPLV